MIRTKSNITITVPTNQMWKLRSTAKAPACCQMYCSTWVRERLLCIGHLREWLFRRSEHSKKHSHHYYRLTHTVVSDTIQACGAKTVTTLPMDKRIHKEYFGGHTVAAGKTKIFLFTVRLTVWKSNRSKNIWGKTIEPNSLPKNFGPNVLPRFEFHMVRHTVVDDMLTWCAGSTVTCVPMLNRASK